MHPGREYTDWGCCDLWDRQTSKTVLSHSQDSADQLSRHGFPGSSCGLMGRKGLAFLLPRANVVELFITCLTANRSKGSWKFSGWSAELKYKVYNLVQHCSLNIFIQNVFRDFWEFWQHVYSSVLLILSNYDLFENPTDVKRVHWSLLWWYVSPIKSHL